ncbi:MMPL family transporter [Bacillus pseudomycoides]|uniref:MMPL family transporter n=1 Tax=Bacillus pseudomycoides TaxID=64104 RepID=UPI0005070082|nr:MMPL family transporter [Bacillus pseudomycoides]KFN11886.1 patched family protein [Bacillus pseudomycoides]MDR4189346.1 MMPL family transporter [Bacillus pseudomycoides]MED0857567.1 MMPL family transporter [Bacillus pseudomycoides]
MLKWLQSTTDFASSKKGAKIIVVSWIIIMLVLTGVSKPAKKYANNVSGDGIPKSAASLQAEKQVEKYFPNDEGLPAIIVFDQKEEMKEEELQHIQEMTKRLEDKKIKHVEKIVPISEMPVQMLTGFLSKDKTSFILPVTMTNNLEVKEIHNTVNQIKKELKQELPSSMEAKVTGPAGIAADTLEIFKNADVVLLLSTIGLIFVLLIMIYRSPLLAVIPLIAAIIVYQVIDRTLGLFGKFGLEIKSQSLSIMSILLFAALTDYALFIFARYKEELQKREDKYESMKQAMRRVGEPIFFSGSTVLASMLMLFFAVYNGYRNFAPLFSIALVVIILGGITLLPALFTLFGRKAFWPYIPKVGQRKEKHVIWKKVSHVVVSRPYIIGGAVAVFLIVCSMNIFQIKYSFNLLKSFPDNLESRQGYELIEKKYSPGQLAPITVVVNKEGKLSNEEIVQFVEKLDKQKGVEGLNPSIETIKKNTSQLLSEDGKAAKVQLILKDQPYSLQAMDTIQSLQSKESEFVKDGHVYFAGETAKQADLYDINNHDTTLIVVLISILIFILLGIQTKSLIAPIYMIGTILLSYCAALGLSMFLFQHLFGYTDMSYRIPLYTFVFLVALGVDYNIMLVSRIKEEAAQHSLQAAIENGLTATGGVISSAGIILAATFAVLTTQPLLELFMFGFVVALGVIIDTFLVRTLLVPAIMLLLKKWSLWPQKMK